MPLLAFAGCAGLAGVPATGPDGLALRDRDLRGLLAAGRYGVAYERIAEGRARPDDRLLRFQYEGLVAHYAGRFGRSNASLQAASDLAEKRYTRSLTKSALSLVTNDRILAYRPPAVERLLIHYYGALNYLGMGDPEGAGVEARRLSHLLDLYADRGELDGPGGRRLHAALRYVAGAAFEAIGEENDAAVAYRLAHRLDAEGRLPGAAPAGEEATAGPEAAVPTLASATEPGGTGGEALAGGEVLVIVERGFAAHRVERATTLLVWPDEIETLRAASSRGPLSDDDPAAELALGLASRALGRGAGTSRPERLRAAGERSERSEGREPPRLPRGLRIAWPVYTRSDPGRLGRGPVRLLARASSTAGIPEPEAYAAPGAYAVPIGGIAPRGPSPPGSGPEGASSRPWPAAGVERAAVEGAAVAWLGDVSAALVEEGRRREPAIVARAIVRAAAKLAIARGIEEELEEEDEMLGEITGSLLSAAAALTERADTRCWSLLPAEIGLVRLRLPPGPQRLELQVEGWRGGERLDLGEVRARSGRLVVVDARSRL